MSNPKRNTALILTLAALAVVAPAAAAQVVQQDKALPESLRALEQAQKQKQEGRIRGCIEQLVRSAKGAKKKKDKAAVRRRLKCCLNSRWSIEIQLAAVRGYGELKMRRSSHDLRKLLDRRKAKRRPPEVVMAAMIAWGKISDSGSHDLLLAYIKVPASSAGKRELAKHAARALAGFAMLTGHDRYEMLRDFMGVFRLIHDAGSGKFMASRDAGAWWAALECEMVESFNMLTGESCKTYAECWSWWQKNKRRVKAGKR